MTTSLNDFKALRASVPTETQKELLILFSSDPVTADITPLGTLTPSDCLSNEDFLSSTGACFNNANLGGGQRLEIHY